MSSDHVHACVAAHGARRCSHHFNKTMARGETPSCHMLGQGLPNLRIMKEEGGDGLAQHSELGCHGGNGGCAQSSEPFWHQHALASTLDSA